MATPAREEEQGVNKVPANLLALPAVPWALSMPYPAIPQQDAGTSGIGGVGYFDTRTNQFHIDHYAEIADWSASALLVEDEDLWIGLVRQPEGSAMPGGLARIARRSGKVTKFDVSAIVRRIVRWNHSIYMGTSEGIFVLSGDRLVHLSFEPDLNGRYSLVMK